MLHYLCPHLPLTHKVCPHPNQTSNFNGHKLHISTSSHFSITSTPFWFSSSTTNSICSSSTFSYYCFYHQYKRERERTIGSVLPQCSVWEVSAASQAVVPSGLPWDPTWRWGGAVNTVLHHASFGTTPTVLPRCPVHPHSAAPPCT